MDIGRYRAIRDRGCRRLHVGNQVGRLGLTGLGHVELVADPGDAPPTAKVRIQIVWRTDIACCWWEPICTGPPSETRGCGHVVLHPDVPQYLDGRDLSQPGSGIDGIDR